MVDANYIFSVSMVLPTLNSARTLDECLKSIAVQEYARDKIELIIVDAGSTDGTLKIVEKYRSGLSTKILENPLKTGEAGKARGIKAAENDIICLIDSDNILPDKDWLGKMMLPFADPAIVAAEPREFTWRSGDGFINRYGALMGMSDPLCFFTGNYDKYNYINGRWTGVSPFLEEEQDGYYKVTLKQDGRLPTVGANGFLVRREELQRGKTGDYLFDVDVVQELLAQNNGVIAIAKVKTGIIHLFAASIAVFIRKQARRMRDYLYYRLTGERRYNSAVNYSRWGMVKFVLYCLLVFPLFIQAIVGYAKKRDAAWFFHPPACWITLVVYAIEFIRGSLSKDTVSRERWRQ